MLPFRLGENVSTLTVFLAGIIMSRKKLKQNKLYSCKEHNALIKRKKSLGIIKY